MVIAPDHHSPWGSKYKTKEQGHKECQDKHEIKAAELSKASIALGYKLVAKLVEQKAKADSDSRYYQEKGSIRKSSIKETGKYDGKSYSDLNSIPTSAYDDTITKIKIVWLIKDERVKRNCYCCNQSRLWDGCPDERAYWFSLH